MTPVSPSRCGPSTERRDHQRAETRYGRDRAATADVRRIARLARQDLPALGVESSSHADPRHHKDAQENRHESLHDMVPAKGEWGEIKPPAAPFQNAATALAALMQLPILKEPSARCGITLARWSVTPRVAKRAKPWRDMVQVALFLYESLCRASGFENFQERGNRRREAVDFVNDNGRFSASLRRRLHGLIFKKRSSIEPITAPDVTLALDSLIDGRKNQYEFNNLYHRCSGSSGLRPKIPGSNVRESI